MSCPIDLAMLMHAQQWDLDHRATGECEVTVHGPAGPAAGVYNMRSAVGDDDPTKRKVTGTNPCSKATLRLEGAETQWSLDIRDPEAAIFRCDLVSRASMTTATTRELLEWALAAAQAKMWSGRTGPRMEFGLDWSSVLPAATTATYTQNPDQHCAERPMFRVTGAHYPEANGYYFLAQPAGEEFSASLVFHSSPRADRKPDEGSRAKLAVELQRSGNIRISFLTNRHRNLNGDMVAASGFYLNEASGDFFSHLSLWHTRQEDMCANELMFRLGLVRSSNQSVPVRDVAFALGHEICELFRHQMRFAWGDRDLGEMGYRRVPAGHRVTDLRPISIKLALA